MLILISSGRGPIECERAVYLYYKELLKEYPSIEVVSINGDDKYAKSILLYCEEDVSHLEGTVQWIYESDIRKNHKRKNWFIDISILKEKLRFDQLDDIRFESFRSSGKGGQNVNKVSTAIRAIHIPTNITAISMEQRSQIQNKKIAYIRLLNKLKNETIIANKGIDYDNWNHHNHMIRGNPYRVYKGKTFKRIKE